MSPTCAPKLGLPSRSAASRTQVAIRGSGRPPEVGLHDQGAPSRLTVRLADSGLRPRAHLAGDAEHLLERPACALRTDGLVEIGLKNTGERAARHTIVNLVAPRWLEELSWAEPGGSPKRGDARPPASTPDERLTDASGQEHSGIYLTEAPPLIGRRPAYVRYARFLLPSGVESIPFRAVAQSDDLPEEVFEVREDFLLRLRPREEG